ncbi:phosphoribosylglycinamide formyltransferase [Desulfitobacterium metallireducens]|uniref:Phosphoribosylglycinamide formyltransferase n=1 Tax=Desulfitobacterium metallireducens DSM 15288 TaxID=871968 RepID=W0EAZ6_9FIRM|nr:phosphoribosylglycinamide formyltransferase [Desulfitobacterium metallireducens]AHF06399.1 phosphoribosylglycinamide formyltransferase [Desulfitobacterium metallireducens DSM 15288]
MRIGVLASGRGSNLQALIEAWQEGKFPAEFVAVGSDHAEALALKRAEKANIPQRAFPLKDYSTRGEQEQAILDWLKESQVELLVLAGFMRVLSSDFLSALNCPVLNIHPSLLPSFPGLHAQRQAIEYGVKVAGCTVHFVDEGLDSGPIILQEAVPVEPGDTEETLTERILKVEHKLYPEAVRLVTTGQIK